MDISTFQGLGLSNIKLGNESKTTKLEETLKNKDLKNADDEELMEVCKSFEAYFVEQVFKEMKSTIHSSEEEGEYMEYFGDMLVQSYAEEAAEKGDLGIAQMLYDSMRKQ